MVRRRLLCDKLHREQLDGRCGSAQVERQTKKTRSLPPTGAGAAPSGPLEAHRGFRAGLAGDLGTFAGLARPSARSLGLMRLVQDADPQELRGMIVLAPDRLAKLARSSPQS